MLSTENKKNVSFLCNSENQPIVVSITTKTESGKRSIEKYFVTSEGTLIKKLKVARKKIDLKNQTTLNF